MEYEIIHQCSLNVRFNETDEGMLKCECVRQNDKTVDSVNGLGRVQQPPHCISKRQDDCQDDFHGVRVAEYDGHGVLYEDQRVDH